MDTSSTLKVTLGLITFTLTTTNHWLLLGVVCLVCVAAVCVEKVRAEAREAKLKEEIEGLKAEQERQKRQNYEIARLKEIARLNEIARLKAEQERQKRENCVVS